MASDQILYRLLGIGQEGDSPLSTGLDLASTMVSLAPLGVGVAIGYNELQSNTSFQSGANTRGVSRQVGDNLQRLNALREASKSRSMEKIKNIIMSDSNLENVLREASDQRTATLTSLLASIEETDIADKDSFRAKVLDLIDNQATMIDEDIASVKRAVQTVFEQNEEVRSAFDNNVNKFKNVANQIVAPTASLTGLKPKITDGLSSNAGFAAIGDPNSARVQRARGIFNEIKSTLGGGANIGFSTLQEFGSEAKGTSLFMDVNWGSGRSFKIPLSLAHLEDTTTKASAPIVRLGDQATTMLGRAAYIDVARLDRDYISQGKVLTSAEVNRINRLKGSGMNQAVMGYESWFAKNVIEQLDSSKTGRLSHAQMKYLNTIGRTGAVALDRAARHGGSPHLITQHLVDSASALTFNSERTSNKEIMALAHSQTGSVLRPGASAGTERIEEIGFKSKEFGQTFYKGTGSMLTNSPLNSIRTFGLLEETMDVLLPATARIRQMMGRKEQFVNSNHLGKKLPSTLGHGSIQSFGQNLGFASGVTGGINTAVLMDLKGGDVRLGLGDGMAYWGMSPSVKTPITKTFIDSNSIGREGYALQEHLKTLHKQGKPLHLKTRAEVQAFMKKFQGTQGGGAILGLLDTGFSEISNYSDMTELKLQLHDMTESMGRDRYHVSGFMRRSGTPTKVYSQGMKGTISLQQLNEPMMNDLMGRMGLDKKTFKNLNLKHNQLMVNAGSMMGKSAWYVGNQMLSSIGLMGKVDMEAMYSRAAGAYSQNWQQATTAGAQRKGYLKETAEFAAREISKLGSGVSSQSIGLAFGGLHYIASEGKHGFDPKGKDVKEIEGIIKKHFGGRADIDSILEETRQHRALGAFTMIAGTPASEYRATLGSMEPRFYEFMHHRLKNVLGFSDREVSDFMTGIIARKEGSGAQLTAYKELSKSLDSMTGRQVLFSEDVVGNLAKTEGGIVSVKDFVAQAGGDERRTKEFLASKQGGFVLDFADDSANQFISKTAKDRFGRSNIYIGGANLLNALDSPLEILQAEDNVRIQNEYVRRVNDLARDLETVISSQGKQSASLAEAQTRVGSFKDATASIWAQTGRSITRGKLLGSGMVLGQGLTLFGPAGNEGWVTAGLGSIDDESSKISKFRRTFTGSGFATTFADSQAFLDSMRTYMGGAAKEIAATQGISMTKARAKASTETAQMFNAFFLGMEAEYTPEQMQRLFNVDKAVAQEKGLTTAGAFAVDARHPLVTTGHVSFGKLFRSDYDADKVWKAFSSTEEGARLIDRASSAYYGYDKATKSAVKTIGSFNELANLAIAETGKEGKRQRIQRLKLFRGMANNISKFAGEGHGHVFFPDMNVNVHYVGQEKTTQINFGKAAMMIGDYDGDFYQLYMTSEKRHLMSRGQGFLDKSIASDIVFAKQTQEYFKAAKEGIANMSKDARALTALESIFEETLKEQYAKNVGPLNVKLDQLRLGMINTIADGSASDRRLAQRGIAMWGAVQEVANIKAKKLTRATDLPNMLTAAVAQGIESRGANISALEGLLRGGIFKDSAFINGKLDYGRVEADLIESGVPKAVRNEMIGAFRSAGAETFDDVMAFTRKSFATVKDLGIDQMGTLSRDTRMGLGETESARRAYLHMIDNANAIQAGFAKGNTEGIEAARGYISDALRNVEKASKGFNARALGPVAAGAAATLGLGILTGDTGYSKKPLIMPGEISDHRVNAAIASGNFGGQHHIPPEGLQQRPHMDMINRPINTQEAYFSKSNAWQIRGEATSRKGLGDLGHIISSMGGSTSVRMNDTRLPITRAYIERIMGD